MKLAAFAFIVASFAAAPFSVAVENGSQDRSGGVSEMESVPSLPALGEAHTFSWGFHVELSGVVGTPDQNCVDEFSSNWVAAYNQAHQGEDVVAEACVVTNMDPDVVTFQGLRASPLQGSYGTSGSGNYRCSRCSPGFVSFFENLKAMSASGDMTTILLADLRASSCAAFASLTDLDIEFIPNPPTAAAESSPSSAATVESDGYTFTWNFHVDLGGVTGDCSSCVDAFDSALVAAYNEAHAGEDVVMESAQVESFTPEGVTIELGTKSMGSYGTSGSGNYRCSRCSPGFVSFLNKKDHLEAMSTLGDMDDILLTNLRASSCAAFASLTSADITFLPPTVEVAEK